MSRRLEFGGAPISDELCIRIDQTGEAAVHVPPEKPIFVGHYWLRGDPAPLSEKVACLDYSVAKGDKLVGYRWDGESIIDPQKFVWVDADRSTMET